VTEANDGMLYGSTSAEHTPWGWHMFRLNKDGSSYNIFHSFSIVSNDSRFPQGALIQASDGGLYGTGSTGGSSNRGTVFFYSQKMAPATASSIHSLASAAMVPSSCCLLEGSDGLLYGTNLYGRRCECGNTFPDQQGWHRL